MIQQRSSSSHFCRRSLGSSGMGRYVHSLMLSIQHFLCRSRCRLPCRVPWRKVLERLTWGVTCPNHASFCLLTVARRVDPQGRWSCSAPSRWSCAPSRRCREVSSGIWFRRPGSFFKSRQAESTFHSHRRGRRWRETCRAGTYFAKLIVLHGQILLSLAIAVIAEAILMRTSAVDIFVVIILVSMSYGILLLFFSMIINSFRSCSPLLIYFPLVRWSSSKYAARIHSRVVSPIPQCTFDFLPGLCLRYDRQPTDEYQAGTTLMLNTCWRSCFTISGQSYDQRLCAIQEAMAWSRVW